VDLRAYADVLRRRWRVIAAIAITFLMLAAIYSFTRPVVYTGQAEVLVDPGQSSSGLRPDQLVSVETEARLIASASIAAIARRQMEGQVSIPILLEHVSVESTPESLVLDIAFTASTPRLAADWANAFAEAYLSYRRDRAEEALAEERGVLEQMMDELAIQRDEENEFLESAAPGSLESRNAESRRDILNNRIAIIAAQLTQIPVTVHPGEVILPATPPTAPSSPKHPINLALGLFLGLFTGIGAAFVWDRMDDRVTSRLDLEAATGAPTLAIIPRAPADTPQGTDVLVVEHHPRSPAAEAYGTLRTNVMALGRRRGNVIGVTGVATAEGKTTTVANLSAALAQADKNVLAISADLRRPRLNDFFSVQNEPGLSEFLADESPLEKVLRQARPNLQLITSGSLPAHPTQLLQSASMAKLIDRARASFDFVIIDLPPVLGLADTLAVAPLLDGTLFVARAGRTRQAAIRLAVAQLLQVGAMIDGGVLNDVIASRFMEYKFGYEYAPPNGSRDGGEVTAPASPGTGERAPHAGDEPEVTERPRPKP
jgi:capsular exopolysaccharide synthesis family protein